MSPLLAAAGLLAVTGALLLTALVVLPAGPRRVPLSRLDPTVAPSAPREGDELAASGIELSWERTARRVASAQPRLIPADAASPRVSGARRRRRPRTVTLIPDSTRKAPMLKPTVPAYQVG